MYNLDQKLSEFYNSEVRLTQEDKNNLRQYKKLNLERLNSGLIAINESDGTSHPIPESLEQGSIPMNTANRHEDNDYDIDVAIIFPKEEISSNPRDVRKFVEKALKKKSGNFSRQPEARTNAVTVWYTEGYHVDFAIYRKSYDFLGRPLYEHAGPDWMERNPRAITDWFNNKVLVSSPKRANGATVADNQLRRIVRLIKKFSKSRENWSLPGGFIISILVSECYQPNYYRDDVALVETVKRLNQRLKFNKSVYNPVNLSIELTEKQKYKHEVNRFSEKLSKAEKRLGVLENNECSANEAFSAWRWLFNSDFWQTTEKRFLTETRSFSSNTIDLEASLHESKNGFQLYRNIPNGRFKIPKDMWIKFSANISVPPPFDVKWKVENHGDEAKAIPDMGHETNYKDVYSSNIVQWERTAYKGKHSLVCEVSKGGNVISSTAFEVLIKK